MSAGMMPTATTPNPSASLSLLAPRFRLAVESAIDTCNAAGLDAMVYEGYRSPELQRLYYARGRTVKPPYHTVTNARTNLHSWHGFALAVDVISRSKLWDAGASWFAQVAAIFKRNGCDWGGDWLAVDLPHFQWGTLRATPSDRARHLLASGGMAAVWREVGADGPAAAPPVPKPRILTMGVVGQDVAELQRALGAPPSGVFDAITDAWVRGFQRGKGLAIDGDVGPNVRGALAA